MALVLILLALILTIIALVDSKGKAFVVWAVLCLVLLHLLAVLPNLPK